MSNSGRSSRWRKKSFSQTIKGSKGFNSRSLCNYPSRSEKRSGGFSAPKIVPTELVLNSPTKKKIRNEDPLCAGLPKEIWTTILYYVNDIQDMGRLERVCKTFYSIMRRSCWPRVEQIDIEIHNWLSGTDEAEDYVINGTYFCASRQMQDATAAVAQRSTNLSSIKLSIPCLDYRSSIPGILPNVFQILAVNSPRTVRHLSLASVNSPAKFEGVRELARLIQNLSDSLKVLEIGFPGHVQDVGLSDAIGNCSQLESLNLVQICSEFDWFNFRVALRDKPSLRYFSMESQSTNPEPVAAAIVDGLKEGGAQISELTLGVPYLKTVIDLHKKSPNHVTCFKDLKHLCLIGFLRSLDGLFARELFNVCPNLEKLEILPPSEILFYCGKIAAEFLRKNYETPATLKELLVFPMHQWYTPDMTPMVNIAKKTLLPEVHRISCHSSNSYVVEETEDGEKQAWTQFTFRKGNAQVRIRV